MQKLDKKISSSRTPPFREKGGATSDSPQPSKSQENSGEDVLHSAQRAGRLDQIGNKPRRPSPALYAKCIDFLVLRGRGCPKGDNARAKRVPIWSILDANFGRLSEGLRVLEDMSRFILRDYKITRKLKETRHSLLEESKPFDLEFLNSRGEDIGASLFVADEGNRKNFVDLVVANAKRAEESLRVLEEYFKFLENKNWRKFQDSRFLLYNIEKEIVSNFLRREKVKKLFPLYVILDAKYFEKKNPVELLKEVIEGGAKAVQLRDKKNEKRKILETALSLKKICQKASVLFLVNDYVDIALAADADGVHLGDDDLPVTAVRKILSFEKIIGHSVHSQKEAKKAEEEGADYLSVGAIYPTTTKENAILVKPSLIREIKNKISLPIIAVGGINENNLDEVMKFEVDGIAISKAVLDKSSPKTAVKKILLKLNPVRKGGFSNGVNK